MSLHKRIKDLCKENGTSLNKLEEELVFSKGYLSKIDNIAPNYDRIKAIADYFGMTMDELISGEEKPAPTDEDGLTALQQEAVAVLKRLDDKTLMKVVQIAQILLQ